MKIANQINEIIKHKNSSTGMVAIELGQSQSNLLNKLSRDNLRINELEEIANALGYTRMEIVLRDNHETVVISENEPIKIDSNDTVHEEAISYNIKKNSTKKLDDSKQIERINLLCQSPQLNPHINIIYNIIQSLYIAQTGYDSILSAYKAAPDIFGVEDTIPVYETCEQEVLKALEQHINSNTYDGFLKEYLDWQYGDVPDKED